MNVVETEWWSMALAPEWWADVEEDGTVLVADEDDVGCLEITTLHKQDGALEQAELKYIAETESPGAAAWGGGNLRRLRWLGNPVCRGGSGGARMVPRLWRCARVCQLQLQPR